MRINVNMLAGRKVETHAEQKEAQAKAPAKRTKVIAQYRKGNLDEKLARVNKTLFDLIAKHKAKKQTLEKERG